MKKSPIAGNGWNRAAGMPEDALDQVIEDSFPASDPPSHTPTTGPGARAKASNEPLETRPHRLRRPATIMPLSLGFVAAATATVAVWRRNARARQPGRVRGYLRTLHGRR